MPLSLFLPRLGSMSHSSAASFLGGIVDSLGLMSHSSAASFLGGIVDSTGYRTYVR